MHARDVNIALLIQALERVDEEGALISFDERRRADQLLEGDRVGSPSDGILARAQRLSDTAQRAAPMLWELALKPQVLNIYVRYAALGLCLCLGFGVHSFGSRGALHVLSPALLGLILWNVVSLSMLILLSRGGGRRSPLKRERSSSARSSTSSGVSLSALYERINSWGQRRWLQRRLRAQRDAQLQLRAAQVYAESMSEVCAPLIAGEVKRTLHLGAALFALGALGGAYWEGVVRSYQVTAASTFLSVESVNMIAEWVLLPARLFWGDLPPLNVSEVTLIAHQGASPQPTHGPAAPWVHCYAISVFTWVITPRLALAALEGVKLWRSRVSIPARLGWFESVPTLNLALAAHTNIGKTSLARTLLRRDVGEVRDAEHVTRARASYFLINSSDVRLRLWDTPGFGEPEPIRALATRSHQERDRARERGGAAPRLSDLLKKASTQSSNARSSGDDLSALDWEALRALEEESDLTLYLVPASPTQRQLEQTRAEWSLLGLLDQPALVVINRVTELERPLADPATSEGGQATRSEVVHQAQVERTLNLWRETLSAVKRGPKRYEVYVLDAFSRTYQDERGFYKTLEDLLATPRQPLARRALEIWEASQLDAQSALARGVTRCLEELSELSVRLGSRKRAAVKEAKDELERRATELIQQTRERLLDHIGLEGSARAEGARFALEMMVSASDRRERRTKGAVLGGVLSGLATGLAADVMAGGLTLGGGMIVGGILGALGGVGAVEGYDYMVQRDQEVSLSEGALISVLQSLLLFTLGASAHGRARGAFSGTEWSEASSGGNLELTARRCQEVMSALDARYRKRLEVQLASLRAPYDSTEAPTPQESSLESLVLKVVKRGLQTL